MLRSIVRWLGAHEYFTAIAVPVFVLACAYFIIQGLRQVWANFDDNYDYYIWPIIIVLGLLISLLLRFIFKYRS